MTPAAAADVRRQVEEADAKAAQKQVREAARWTGFVQPLTWFLLLINSYFAARAMFYFADLGGASVFGEGAGAGEALLGTGDRVFMVLTAASLIFAAHVLAVRLAMLTGAARLSGFVILLGLAAYSIITSTLCIALMMQGGVEADVVRSDAYQMARTQAESASARASSASEAAAAARAAVQKAEGDLAAWRATVAASFAQGSAAYNTRQNEGHPEHASHIAAISRARADLSSAQAEAQAASSAAPAALESMEKAKAESGGATSEIMGTVAGWFGTDIPGFVLGFSIFVNVLMEVARLFLAFVTGRGVMDALRRAEHGESDAAPVAVRERPLPQPAEVVPLTVAPRSGRARPFSGRGDWSVSDPKADESEEGGARYGLPRHRRDASYAGALEKGREAIREGRLTSGGLSAIRKATGVSDQVAGRMQVDLEREGYLQRSGARLVPHPEKAPAERLAVGG